MRNNPCSNKHQKNLRSTLLEFLSINQGMHQKIKRYIQRLLLLSVCTTALLDAAAPIEFKRKEDALAWFNETASAVIGKIIGETSPEWQEQNLALFSQRADGLRQLFVQKLSESSCRFISDFTPLFESWLNFEKAFNLPKSEDAEPPELCTQERKEAFGLLCEGMCAQIEAGENPYMIGQQIRVLAAPLCERIKPYYEQIFAIQDAARQDAAFKNNFVPLFHTVFNVQHLLVRTLYVDYIETQQKDDPTVKLEPDTLSVVADGPHWSQELSGSLHFVPGLEFWAFEACILAPRHPIDFPAKDLPSFFQAIKQELTGHLGGVSYCSHSGCPYAVKCYQFEENPIPTEELAPWLDTVTTLGHVNLCKILRLDPPSIDLRQGPMLWMKYFPNGSLNACLLRVRSGEPQQWPCEMRIAIICGIVAGMQVLHGSWLHHGRLKPSNVLLDESYGACITGYLSNAFGMNFWTYSCLVSDPRYTAQELYNYEDEEMSVYEEKDICQWQKVDVFATGLVLYEILTGSPVFGREKSAADLRRQTQSDERASIPGYVHRDMAQLIKRCWDKDPERRPLMGEICQIIYNLRGWLFSEPANPQRNITEFVSEQTWDVIQNPANYIRRPRWLC
jgi:serine/threonine protein kinase